MCFLGQNALVHQHLILGACYLEEEHRVFVQLPVDVILKVVLLHLLFFALLQLQGGLDQLDETAPLLGEPTSYCVLNNLPQLSLVGLVIVVHARVLEYGGIIKEVIAVVVKVACLNIDDLLVGDLQMPRFGFGD